MLSVCNDLAWITDASWERDGLFVQRDKCLCTPWQTREKRGVGALPPRKLLFCRRLKWRVHVFFFFFWNFLGFRLSQSLSQSGGKWELYSFFAALSVTQKTSWLVASLMSGVLSLRAVVWFLLYSGKRDRQCDYFGGYSNDTQYCCTVLTPTLIFTGGSTMLPGLGERLHKEITTLVNPRDPGRVRVISPDDRKYAVWSGSAVLAGLSTFPQMCISMQEYDEMGPEIVHRKCF